MANSKISALAAVTTIGATDEYVTAVGGATKKITGANLKTQARTGAVYQLGIPLNVGDASGNAYPLLIVGSNTRMLVPAFVKDVEGFWYGILRVPKDYASGGKIVIRVGSSGTSAQVTSMTVGTVMRDAAAGWDAAAYTNETVQDLTVSTTAYRPTEGTFTLTTVPAADKDMLVRINHNGTKTEDNLAVDTILFQAVFEYTT